MGKCRFKASWLQELDSNGHVIQTWGRNEDNSHMYCVVCEKKICVDRGKTAINQHVQTSTHKQQYKIKNENQQKISRIDAGPILFNPRRECTKAELVWTLRLVQQNQSFESVSGLKDIIKFTMPDCRWIDNFSLSPKKVSYYVTYALAPYFYKLLTDDIKGSGYSLLYDETTNKAHQKELQIRILYWSQQKDEVASRHLQTFYMHHAKAEDLVSCLHKAMEKFNLQGDKLIMLGNDGPNVNKKVFNTINAETKRIRKVGLVDVGTCNLHVINNAFLKGLNELGRNVADLSIALKYFFKEKPARIGDFEYCQNKTKTPKKHFIKHVSSRWLTLEKAAERVLELWPAIDEYFLKYIPKNCKSIEKTRTYKTVVDIIKNKTIIPELIFVVSSARIFNKFNVFFQNSQPLIHLLHEHILQLLKNLMIHFCKPETILKVDSNDFNYNEIFTVDCFIPVNNYKEIVGVEICCEFDKLKVSEQERLIFANKVRKHYAEACKYIFKKIPLFEQNVLKWVKCINPLNFETFSSSEILHIAKQIPNFTYFNELGDEWNLLKLEKIDINRNTRVDHFWREIFNMKLNVDGVCKYPNLKKVIQTVLCISHGNAEVERGFSKSGRIVTYERNNLNEATLNSLLFVADTIKTVFFNKIENIEITNELYSLAKHAHSSYEAFLEEKKRHEQKASEALKKAEEERLLKESELIEKANEQIKVTELQKSLKYVETQERAKREASVKLLSEANSKLKQALKSNNLIEANIASSLLQAVQNLQEEQESLKSRQTISPKM